MSLIQSLPNSPIKSRKSLGKSLNFARRTVPEKELCTSSAEELAIANIEEKNALTGVKSFEDDRDLLELEKKETNVLRTKSFGIKKRMHSPKPRGLGHTTTTQSCQSISNHEELTEEEYHSSDGGAAAGGSGGAGGAWRLRTKQSLKTTRRRSTGISLGDSACESGEDSETNANNNKDPNNLRRSKSIVKRLRSQSIGKSPTFRRKSNRASVSSSPNLSRNEDDFPTEDIPNAIKIYNSFGSLGVDAVKILVQNSDGFERFSTKLKETLDSKLSYSSADSNDTIDVNALSLVFINYSGETEVINEDNWDQILETISQVRGRLYVRSQKVSEIDLIVHVEMDKLESCEFKIKFPSDCCANELIKKIIDTLPAAKDLSFDLMIDSQVIHAWDNPAKELQKTGNFVVLLKQSVREPKKISRLRTFRKQRTSRAGDSMKKEIPIFQDEEVFKALCSAIDTGDLEIFKTEMEAFELAKNTKCIHTKGNGGGTIVHHAASMSEANILKYMFTNMHASPNIQDDNGENILHAATRGGCDALSVVLDHDPQKEARNKFGYTSLHLASILGSIECVALLVIGGANVNAKDNNDRTPKDFAKKYNHSVCQAYLEKVSDVEFSCIDRIENIESPSRKRKNANDLRNRSNTLNLSNSRNRDFASALNLKETSSLATASIEGSISTPNLAKMTKEHHQTSSVPSTRQRTASINSLNKTANLLDYIKQNEVCHTNTNSGNKVGNKEKQRRSILFEQVILENEEVSEHESKEVLEAFGMIERNKPLELNIMLSKFIDATTVRGENGEILLHYAAALGQVDCIREIIRYCNINMTDLEGESALHVAVRAENLECIEYLLQSGCNADISNHCGKTCLHIAALFGKDKAIDKLLQYKEKVSLDKTDNKLQTALDIAIYYGNEASAKLLEGRNL